ncbi:glycosyltransferase family 4 protein [Desulfovibrio subterraneus]|uniref:glycosyltransferase family 4 protein n=1 Tax=Desulfovibrio subterraneus TaxID=2718620 RepID=UPI0022B9393D|nr:glycosyltransferase family 4 protein [Desulfovibrio subterraneus]WBF66834.1 glycosyltransferase family 4 protein [Desulfovibrio subterraneus]
MLSGKPSLLFVSQNLPKRFASSGVTRLYFFVKMLCRDFDVVVATYFMPAFDKSEDVAALEALGARVEAVPFNYPHEGSDRFSRKLPDRVQALLGSDRFDIIHLERFWMHICLEGMWDSLGIPVVLDEMDVEYKREERRFSVQGADPAARETWERERRQELETCRRASTVIAVTEADRQTLLAELPELHIVVIPTGQDVAWLNATLPDVEPDVVPDVVSDVRPASRSVAGADRPHGVVFCGDYRHNPNVDAALYLAKDVWPLVKKQVPDATLTLLGGSPTPELLALAGDDIEVPGWVDDLRPYYRREKVALAPIRFGSGIKAKIIEAAACGLPVVTTGIGAEGLTLERGTDYFVEDDVQALADKTSLLLGDAQLRATMGAKGRNRALEYDWEALYPVFSDIYLTLVADNRKNAGR